MDKTDAEIRRSLKNWAAQRPTPASARGRLIGVALRSSAASEGPPATHFSAGYNELFSWAMVYSMGRGIAASRLVS